MTHTPGFEEGIHDAFVKDAKDLYPLGDYMKKRMPDRIYPPGKVVAYSNYGASLAGYIVQRVSGEQYADYIANHILKPLGMTHSTFQQPLPASLAPFMSNGYAKASDEKPTAVRIDRDGACRSDVGDRHRHGAFHDRASEQRQLQRRLDPVACDRGADAFAAIADGAGRQRFRSRLLPGEPQRPCASSAMPATQNPFHSDLHLLLDKNVGVFMSFNSQGNEGESDKFRTTLFRAFLDRYFPYPAPEEATVADPKPDAARVAGWYE